MYDKATVWARFLFIQEGPHSKGEAKSILSPLTLDFLKWEESDEGWTSFDVSIELEIDCDGPARRSYFEEELHCWIDKSKLELEIISIIIHNQKFEP